MVNKTINPNVHFTIECHGGAMPSSASTTYVSSHWVRSCLEVNLKALSVLMVDFVT